MKKLFFLVLFSVHIWIVVTNGQQGIMTFKVVQLQVPDSLVSQQINTIKKNISSQFTMRIYFRPGLSRMEVEALNGMIYIQNFWVDGKQELTIFSDVFGRRTKTRLNKDEIHKLVEMNKDSLAGDEIIRTNQFKSVMGLKCQLIKFKDHEQEELWISPDLHLPVVGYGLERFGINGLGGFPLEYSINISGLSLTIRAIDLNNKTSKDDFLQPGGYENLTWDEFIKLGTGF